MASILVCFSAPGAVVLSEAEAQRIGHRVWQNECNGTVTGLTAWNAGEDFASLGIGHFIWYPAGRPGPFEESFPRLVAFAAQNGVKLPAVAPGADTHCPWNSRAEFKRAEKSEKMKELREFLARTVNVQAHFLARRLQEALPKMVAEAAPGDRARVQQQFERLAGSAAGRYALIDYVNFKGEGVLATERYGGQGWGLLQVLEQMSSSSPTDATREFSRAAAVVLKRRVSNSPPARHESRWLPGWLNRVNSYSRN